MLARPPASLRSRRGHVHSANERCVIGNGVLAVAIGEPAQRFHARSLRDRAKVSSEDVVDLGVLSLTPEEGRARRRAMPPRCENSTEVLTPPGCAGIR